MKQPSVGEQGFDGSAGIGLTRPALEFVDLILDFARRCYRCIERQLQHCSCGSTRGLGKLGRRGTGTKPHKIRQRIVQQRVLALEALDKLLLPVEGSGKPIDRRRGVGVDGGGLAQPVERIAQRIDFVDQRIVIAQSTRARREDVAVKRVLQHGEMIDLGKRTVEHLGFRIDRAQRQPGQQQDQSGDDRNGRSKFHGLPPVTGEPR